LRADHNSWKENIEGDPAITELPKGSYNICSYIIHIEDSHTIEINTIGKDENITLTKDGIAAPSITDFISVSEID
jgi:hypothetical protein